MCVILPQVTGMVQGRTLRHELLESKAGFSNTLNSPQKLQSIIALWIIEKKKQTKKTNSSCEKPFNRFYSTTKAW